MKARPFLRCCEWQWSSNCLPQLCLFSWFPCWFRRQTCEFIFEWDFSFWRRVRWQNGTHLVAFYSKFAEKLILKDKMRLSGVLLKVCRKVDIERKKLILCNVSLYPKANLEPSSLSHFLGLQVWTTVSTFELILSRTYASLE